MSVIVEHLLESVLLLPKDSQAELVEAILERSEPSRDFLDHQLGIVRRRVQSVQDGSSLLIEAEDAHKKVLESLKL
jgi:hypothetical protein